MNKLSHRWVVAAVAAVALLVGYVGRGCLFPGAELPRERDGATTEPAASGQPPKVLWWTCSMHHQIHRSGPGQCPICGMDLVPVTADAGDADAPVLTVSKAAAALMDIQTSVVERRYVSVDVRMPGVVAYDETRLAYITAWAPGRLDRLYIDYTGVTVARGEHMAYLYSPELFAAQQELIQALGAVEGLENSRSDIIRATSQATVEAAREKLRLFGLTAEQVAEIEARGTAEDHLTIYAPAGGVVLEKNAQQGMYVSTGTRIYTIADLTQVWVLLDAYESDLMWLRYGQPIEFTAEAYPGERFTGVIAFISPVVEGRTRTVKVRVNVPNPEAKLKPDMFVRGVVHANVAAGGRVMAPDLAGKWICPMHPEVIKETAGDCDVCQMPLVRIESLGYVSADEAARAKPLVIPASAPLITGKRAVVYVQIPDAPTPTFEGVEVVLGPRAGDYYIVESGLGEGQRVVTRGNFKIDSALQIQAKPSMMSPEGGVAPPAHHGGGAAPGPGASRPKPEAPPEAAHTAPVPAAFQQQLGRLVQAYFPVSEALAADDFDKASAAVGEVGRALDGIDMTLLDPDAHVRWMKERPSLQKAIGQMKDAKDIAALRAGFALLSEELPVVVGRFGSGPGAVYRFHCPMAFNNRGADWLQPDKGARNPYFGATMPRCGAVVQTLVEPAEEGPADE